MSTGLSGFKSLSVKFLKSWCSLWRSRMLAGSRFHRRWRYLCDPSVPSDIEEPSGVPKGGQRGESPRAALWGGGKKRKKEKRKKEKKEKGKKEKKEQENMGEACNFNKTIKWSILAAAPLCTYNRTFWRLYPFWRGRVVRLIIRAFAYGAKIYGPYTFWRPYYAKARILTLVSLTYRFGVPLHFGAPMQQKHV